MSDSYFEFKQFTIKQDNCAMKVGTDGVLLGAWINPGNASRILDVGAGTGLIALMLAQRSTAKIDAVEIDKNAALQAKDNIQSSPWSDRIRIFNQSFQIFSKTNDIVYDLIVSNPPFFEAGPKSGNKNRAIARHNDELLLHELIGCSVDLLSDKGRMGLIIPIDLRDDLISCIAKNKLWVDYEVNVKPVKNKQANRILFLLSKNEYAKRIVSEIVIETDKRHHYSKEIKKLFQDYYIKLF